MTLFLSFRGQFCHLYDNIYTGFSNSPVANILCLFHKKTRKSIREKLFRNHLRNDWKMFNSLFSNFNTRIITKWQNLQPNKLFTKLLAEAVTHVTKELDSNNTIILIGVIMCHFDNMFENIVSSIFISKFMRNPA